MTDATLQRPRFQFPVEALRYGIMSQSYYTQVLNFTKQQTVDLDEDYKEMDISNGEKMGITQAPLVADRNLLTRKLLKSIEKLCKCKNV